MHLFSWIDWGFLEAFFGEYGKFVTTSLALVVGFITLAAALLQYLRAKILKKERDAARREFEQSKADLQKEKARVREQQLALKAKEEDLDKRDRLIKKAVVEIKFRQQPLQNIRDAFTGTYHKL